SSPDSTYLFVVPCLILRWHLATSAGLPYHFLPLTLFSQAVAFHNPESLPTSVRNGSNFYQTDKQYMYRPPAMYENENLVAGFPPRNYRPTATYHQNPQPPHTMPNR